MPEIANDPLPRAWERITRTLGFNTAPPKGGLECMSHALGIVSFMREKLGAAMNMGNAQK